MPVNPVIDDLVAQAAATTSVMDSAKVLINGIADRVQTAIDAAIANGATEAQLQPLVQVKADLTNKTQELADAISANTPVTMAMSRAHK